MAFPLWLVPAVLTVIGIVSHYGFWSLLPIITVPILYYIIVICYWFKQMKPVWNEITKFSGPKPHWLYGNLHEHPGPNGPGVKYLQDLTQKYVKAFVMWYTPVKPVLALVHPDSLKPLYRTAEPKPTGLLGNYRLIMPWVGDGLLCSSGDKWFRNRRLLTPAFHFDVLKPYIQVYNEASDIYLSKLSQQCTENDGIIEVYEPINLMTLNVMLRCALSYDEDVQRAGNKNLYVQAVGEMTEGIFDRIFNPLLCLDWLYYNTPGGRQFQRAADVAHDISSKVIAQRKLALQHNPKVLEKSCKDFLDILLLARDEDGKGLSDTEIQDEVDTFLFEGHDTTASSIAWILYSLAGEPHCQKKAQEEIDGILAGRSNDEFTMEDLNHMPYTYQCIREALRMHSPVPLINRELTQDLEIEGVTLKPGTMIDILMICVHHNEDVWGKDHYEFKPERFSHDNMKNMDPYAFVPFSAGPRNCIGQNFALHEIKIAVARTLHRFEMEIVPDKPAEYKIASVMRVMDGMYLKLKPRKQKERISTSN